jgi:hypothetical protein
MKCYKTIIYKIKELTKLEQELKENIFFLSHILCLHKTHEEVGWAPALPEIIRLSHIGLPKANTPACYKNYQINDVKSLIHCSLGVLSKQNSLNSKMFYLDGTV